MIAANKTADRPQKLLAMRSDLAGRVIRWGADHGFRRVPAFAGCEREVMSVRREERNRDDDRDGHVDDRSPWQDEAVHRWSRVTLALAGGARDSWCGGVGLMSGMTESINRRLSMGTVVYQLAPRNSPSTHRKPGNTWRHPPYLVSVVRPTQRGINAPFCVSEAEPNGNSSRRRGRRAIAVMSSANARRCVSRSGARVAGFRSVSQVLRRMGGWHLSVTCVRVGTLRFGSDLDGHPWSKPAALLLGGTRFVNGVYVPRSAAVSAA